MGHQAQVPLNQDIPGFQIPLPCQGKIPFFLCLCQWFGERSRIQLQGIQQSAQHQPYSSQHAITSADTVFTTARPFYCKSPVPAQPVFLSLISGLFPLSPFWDKNIRIVSFKGDNADIALIFSGQTLPLGYYPISDAVLFTLHSIIAVRNGRVVNMTYA